MEDKFSTYIPNDAVDEQFYPSGRKKVLTQQAKRALLSPENKKKHLSKVEEELQRKLLKLDPTGTLVKMSTKEKKLLISNIHEDMRLLVQYNKKKWLAELTKAASAVLAKAQSGDSQAFAVVWDRLIGPKGISQPNQVDITGGQNITIKWDQ